MDKLSRLEDTIEKMRMTVAAESGGNGLLKRSDSKKAVAAQEALEK